jgi:hypothetical protein
LHFLTVAGPGLLQTAREGEIDVPLRPLHVEALDTLLEGHIARVAKARDWELLREVARLAASDAPHDLAVTDPALFKAWRAAVTRYHLAGWTNMTPERVDEAVRFEPDAPSRKTA